MASKINLKICHQFNEKIDIQLKTNKKNKEVEVMLISTPKKFEFSEEIYKNNLDKSTIQK